MKGLAPPKTLTIALAFAALLLAPPAHAQTKLRVGICARTVSMGVGSPFVIAMKMGWFKQEGLDVEIVPSPAPPIA
jgi:ABC-type nitrate/sulfonate/bicarbonate transport system substrate-binding protein